MSATRILSLSLSSYLFLHRWSQFPTIFSRIKDTWIATIEFPIEMPINDLFFFNSSNRVFRNVSYAKCLKCTSFLSRPMLQNFQRFHLWATCKFHDTDERKKKTVRSMCVLNPNSFCSMKIYHLCPMITIEHTQTILNIYRYIYTRILYSVFWTAFYWNAIFCLCIVLSVPPKITPFSFARDLNVGDRTSVQCVVVTGDLPLTFTWLKDNVPIEIRTSQDAPPSSHSRVQAPAGPGDAIKGPKRGPKAEGQAEQSPRKAITVRQYDAFTSALSISTIAPAHNGTYTCRVANGAATVAHSALLHVNGKRTPLVYFLRSRSHYDAEVWRLLSYSLFSLPSPLAIFFPIFQPASSISTCQHAPSLPTVPTRRKIVNFIMFSTFVLSIGSAYLRNDQKFERLTSSWRSSRYAAIILTDPILCFDRFRATKLYMV